MKQIKFITSIIIGAVIGAILFGAPGILADTEINNQHDIQDPQTYCQHHPDGLREPMHYYLNQDPNELTQEQKQEILDHFNYILDKQFEDITNLYQYIQSNNFHENHHYQDNTPENKYNYQEHKQHGMNCW